MQSFWDILRTYQGLGALAFLAFLVTVFLTPLAIRAAHRYGVLDLPDRRLKPHARPIPYLGGTAICVAWAVTLVAALASGVARDGSVLVPVLLGGIAMSALGLLDDVRGVAPKARLLIGAAIISAVLLSTGIGFRLIASLVDGVVLVLTEAGLPPPPALVALIGRIAAPVSVALGVFIVLGACNSANLIDGLDGLCSGVTAIISLGFFLLAAHLATRTPETGDPVRLSLAVAMFGAALGFLPWNFNPAKIFMGDAGSVLLGYNCGMLILLFAERGKLRWVIGALMIFALPVFDTALAMVRRWRAGRSIFEGDRSHFYDQLVQRGLSVRQTVFVCYGLTLLYTAIGLLLTWVTVTLPHASVAATSRVSAAGSPVIRTRWALLLYLGVALATALVAWRAGLVTPEEPRRPAEPASAEWAEPDREAHE